MGAPVFDPGPTMLEGEHVRLEPLAHEHAPDLFEAAAPREIWTWIALVPFTSVADVEAWIDAAQVPNVTSGVQIPFAIIQTSTGKAVGSTRYLNIEHPNRSLEIGWTWLTPGVWRTPVNTECKLLLLSHAFEDLGAVRMQLKTDELNERSRRAIERLGCRFEGLIRNQMIMPDGRHRTSAMYSMLPEEWPDAKAKLISALDR